MSAAIPVVEIDLDHWGAGALSMTGKSWQEGGFKARRALPS
jgi:hypothetical protein